MPQTGDVLVTGTHWVLPSLTRSHSTAPGKQDTFLAELNANPDHYNCESSRCGEQDQNNVRFFQRTQCRAEQ
jgi:hypothetical protein